MPLSRRRGGERACSKAVPDIMKWLYHACRRSSRLCASLIPPLTLAPPSLDRTCRSAPASTSTASKAGDDDVKDCDNAVDDGFEDGSNAVDDGHDTCADGLEDRLDLYQSVRSSVEYSA